MEPGDILEDSWFFGNLPHKHHKMSDPCTTSPPSYEQAYSTIRPPSLTRAPSNPPSQSQGKGPSTGLSRAPSMPTTAIDYSSQDDEEIEFSMGKLIRQASMSKNSDNQPPTRQSPKDITSSPRIGKLKSHKSLNEVEYLRELQGFNELGLVDEGGRSSTRRHRGTGENRKSAPPVPKWSGNGKTSSTQDIKTQIKFWARAVASNVRQEC